MWLVFMGVLLCFSSMAQTRSFFFEIRSPAAKGTLLWEEGNYKEAVPYLEQALSKGGRKKEKQESLQKKLAYAYVHAGNARAASTVYERLLTEGAALEEAHQLHYANALMAAGRLEEGRQQLLSCLQSAGMEEEARELWQNLSVSLLYQDTVRYYVQNASFNTSGSEFSPFLTNGGIIFVSDKPRRGFIKHHFAADQGNGTDLFYGKFDRDKAVESLNRLSSTVNSPFPEGPAALSPDGKKLIFTRAGEQGTMQLLEARVALNLSSWVDIKPLDLPVGGAVGHPAMAEEGQVIYFVSDSPGGYGGTDIYQVRKEAQGWSAPRNLGPKVNTAGNEMFPTSGTDGKLRFSSNGHFGLGGLDIYEVIFDGDSVAEIRNIGAPVNSAADDFGLSMDESGDWGYFSSNRPGGAGADDIYRLQVNVIKLAGRVYDKTNRKGVPGARVRLLKEGNLLEETRSSDKGLYSFKAYPGQEYQVVFEAAEFREHSEPFSTRHGPRYGTRALETGLDRRVKMFVLGTISKKNRAKAAGASLIVIDRESARIDTVMAGAKGDYELELDVSSKYTFLAECEEEKAVITFSTPEKGNASLSYYEHLYMEPFRPYLLKGQIKAPAEEHGPFSVRIINRLSMRQEIMVTDGQGSFEFEAHPLADYDICLLQGSGASVQLKAGWNKPERSLELVY